MMQKKLIMKKNKFQETRTFFRERVNYGKKKNRVFRKFKMECERFI